MTRLAHLGRPWIAALALALGLSFGLAACTDDSGLGEAGEVGSELDTRLETHVVLPGAPSAEGLAYVRAVATAHAKADAESDLGARASILERALEQAPPADDGSAELLRYNLAARAAQTRLDADQPERALTLLQPLLAPERSLPVDRASARGLVLLGDAAARTGDANLAMGSYARALEILTMLLEEVEP